MNRVKKRSHPSRVNRSSDVGTKATVRIVHEDPIRAGFHLASMSSSEGEKRLDVAFQTVKWKIPEMGE
jgi:hypothetical protein